jgi:hypothetical protein
MKQIIRLTVVSLLVAICSAFTVIQQQQPSKLLVRPTIGVSGVVAPMTQQRESAVKPLQMFVDWGVTYDASSALGSILALVAFVSFWEFATPGRAKK